MFPALRGEDFLSLNLGGLNFGGLASLLDTFHYSLAPVEFCCKNSH